MQISLKIEHQENRGFSQKVQNCTIKCKLTKKWKRFQPFPNDILFTVFCSFFWFNPNKILVLLTPENKEFLVNLNATMLNICLLSEHVCCGYYDTASCCNKRNTATSTLRSEDMRRASLCAARTCINTRNLPLFIKLKCHVAFSQKDAWQNTVKQAQKNKVPVFTLGMLKDNTWRYLLIRKNDFCMECLWSECLVSFNKGALDNLNVVMTSALLCLIL